MNFVLDTNVAIHLRDGDDDIIQKMRALDGGISISVVTRVELEGGVYQDKANATIRRARLDRLLATIPAISFDDDAAAAYGQVVAARGFSRRKVLDRMIAATAVAHGATLVTRNASDFTEVSGLELLAW